MKNQVFTMLLLIGWLLNVGGLQSNNITVSNISLTQRNASDDYAMVQFDLSWENSWRTSNLNGNGVTNWDAAWVFVKYRMAGGVWQHARLNNDGHSGTGATMEAGLQTPGSAFNATTNPGVGVFIYRSADGTGTFSITGAKLRWNYGADGVADDALVEVKAFVIEMVYVPEGAFYVGSGGTESGSFTNGSWNSGATIPLLITSEGEKTIAHSAGSLWGTSSAGYNTIGDPGSLPAVFPKGYSSFYCMKYEITQQQYVDFLNTLTQIQASNRKAGNTEFRYAIILSSAGIASTTNPYVACSFLRWMDDAAYSDWAGLRPMTELEYEKACRGTVAAVANEYAWGNTARTAAANITDPGANNETTNTPGANAVFNWQVSGPLRAGVFAKSGTTRIEAGASYYGILELSGNLGERMVTVCNATGRAFTGKHGDGTLSANGHATETEWPGFDGLSSEVTGATGSGFRGGSWEEGYKYLTVSSRYYAAVETVEPFRSYGFRAVRSRGL